MNGYICRNGHHFDRFKVESTDRDTGFEYQVCPVCGTDDFEEAYHCLKCDEYFTWENMIGSICRPCVIKRVTKTNAFRYAWDRMIDDSVLFSATDQEVSVFCLEDEYDFSEWLEGQDD